LNIRVGILTAPKIEYEQREHTFLLKNVRIGIGFHWDRLEDQEFAGALEIRNNADGSQTAINTIDLEEYLCSVISSEMNANSPMELLKAHAVISRSWAMRAIANKPHEQMVNGQMVNDFDVCADDHCQRYEGLRRMNERAVQAVRETAGQVLLYDQMVNGQMVNVPDSHHGSLRAPITLRPMREEPEEGLLLPYKIVEDDRVVIIRNGERYDVTGKKL
jgi:hypothetical protein